MRAVWYLRVSMAEQLKGHSLDAQRVSTTTFIRQRSWTLTGEYLDAGLSAKSDSHRPAFQQLLADAQAGKFDVVVVDKIDRFYRHLKGLLTALELLRAADVTFVSVKENLDFSTPWGKLSLTVLGMLAEIYIDNLSQEAHKGKLARARKGQWNGSIPFGYCTGRCTTCTDPNGPDYCPNYGGPDQATDAHLYPHPVESVAVQRAFAAYLTGELSDGDLAAQLNADGLTRPDGRSIPFRTKGLLGRFPPGPFSKESLRDILQRRFYTGTVVYYGHDERGRKRKRNQGTETFPGQHPALISPADFERAQALRAQLARRPRSPSGQPRVYLLSGLLVCDTCGRPMRGMATGGRRYYRDVTRLEHSGDCSQPTLRAEVIEQQVVDFLTALRLPDDWETWVRNRYLTPAQQATLVSQEQALQQRWARAQELYLTGLFSKAQLQEERWRYQSGLTSLQNLDFNAIMRFGLKLQAWPQAFAQAESTLKRNELLRLVLAGVRVKGDKLTALQPNLYFYPLMLYCLCGDDGTRTRGLGLDRAAC